MATDTTTENAALEARAVVRHLRVTPQNARRIVDLVRGKDTQSVIAMLKFAPQGAAEPVLKLVESAIANLRVKSDEAGVAFDERNLVISTAFVDEGATMKRFRPRAQGRAGRINKRTSHITVVVTSKPEKAAKGGNR